MSTILQKFIGSHLFQLKNDDEFQKLKDAATNLSKNELKKKDNVARYVLSAFDPNINSNEDCLEKTKAHVIKQSPTVLSQSGDSPRTILRAVILESLYTRAVNDIDYARIFWYIGSNVINQYTLGKEKDLLFEVLSEIGEIVEKEAVTEWSLALHVEVAKFEMQNLQISNVNIQSAINAFKTNFQKNLVYQNPAPNHWNQISSSVNSFVSQMKNGGANEIANFVNSSFNKYKESLNDTTGRVQEFISEIEPYLSEVGNQVFKGVSAVNNRSQLLWWKESMYSPSMKIGYREIPKEILAFVIATDLYTIVTQNYPISIDYFLKETIRYLNLSEEELSFDTLIKSLSNNKDYIKKIGIKSTYSNSRITLLEYITAVANDEISNSSKLKENLGIDPKNNLKIDEFAVWLFHELQAYRIGLN